MVIANNRAIPAGSIVGVNPNPSVWDRIRIPRRGGAKSEGRRPKTDPLRSRDSAARRRPKSEARSSKFDKKETAKYAKVETTTSRPGISEFGFRPSFGLRISGY
jgi:hypothetical protein